MKRLVAFVLLFVLFHAVPARAEDVAPGLADDVIESLAEAQLRALMHDLGADDRARLTGIYVAIDSSRTEVLALPACDDDGDYVVVLSRALLELLAHVAYADASDRLRGTHLVRDYGHALARSQWRNARPLPVPGEEAEASERDGVAWLASAFEEDALAWLVADELAYAVSGALVCPSPTATREAGDDVWTDAERTHALLAAPLAMRDVAGADDWATRRVLARGASEVPVLVFLRVVAELEGARPSGEASVYLTLHPHSSARAAHVEGMTRSP